MDEAKVREILGATIRPDGSLIDAQQYTEWSPGDKDIVLDARFTADELEAMAWWMRHASQEEVGQ